MPCRAIRPLEIVVMMISVNRCLGSSKRTLSALKSRILDHCDNRMDCYDMTAPTLHFDET
jgi:hypothetical protein